MNNGKHPLYPNLFSPIRVNNLILKNRIISAPIQFYSERACDGYAMMVRGSGGGNVIGQRARTTPRPSYLETPGGLEQLQNEMTEIKTHGAKASIELHWVGSKAWAAKGDYVYGPVDKVREDGTVVKAMTVEDMKAVAAQYAETARQLKALGFDIQMVHFGHGWGPSEFLYPKYNTRTDEFGGSIENRSKFGRMCLEAIREAVGPDYPLDMRISAEDGFENGFGLEDVIYFVKYVEDLIDMVNLSHGDMSTWIDMITTMYEPHLVNVKFARELKKHVSIPVAIVGAIMTPEEAEEIIASGSADMVILGRAGIADVDWVTKAWNCRSQDIVPCIRCMECHHPTCSVNPRDAHFKDFPKVLPKTSKPKNVVVVGGGPAGVKAAITADEKGHNVTLFEATDRIGGQLKFTDYDDHKIDLKRYKDYMEYALFKSNVNVHLNTKATPEMVKALNPDVIILAMGAKPKTPNIKGVDMPHVIQAVDAYKQLDEIKGDVVVVGGGSVGCEIGVTLHDKGHKVTVVSSNKVLSFNAHRHIRQALILELEKRHINAIKNHRVTEIQENEVTVKNKETGDTFQLHADTVILAQGFAPDIDEAYSFYNITQDTNMIGDLEHVATVGRAVQRAYYLAATID